MVKEQKYLITAALPYANGPIHFGHVAGVYLPADVYCRYLKLKKQDALFVCGSDEYGVAITLSAEQAKRSAQEHVDFYHAVNQKLFTQLDIAFDHYSRTTWPGHAQPTCQFFLDLVANGYIESKVSMRLFSPKENRFLADRYVVGICPQCGYEAARGDECPKCAASFEAEELKNPRSKLSADPLELRPTEHWFLKLDLFKEKLLDWLASKTHWKSNVLHFVQRYIQDLKERAITRDGTWGIPLPIDNVTGKIFYVWFDAPIGYISACQQWAELKKEPEAWKKYWLDPDTRLVQFIGKDNIPFHGAIFPAMIMGQNTPYKLVDDLPANEFLMLEGRQFSKSEGWYVDLEECLTTYEADQIRYTLAANAPEDADAEFTWKDFQMRCNRELLGKWGNFVHRTVTFAHRFLGGKVPPTSSFCEEDLIFIRHMKAEVEAIAHCYEHFQLRKAAQKMMEMAQIANAYFDHSAPWKWIKQTPTIYRAHNTIALCLQACQMMATAAYPIIPATAKKVWDLLGINAEEIGLGWDHLMTKWLPENSILNTPHVLFAKIEDTQIEKEMEKLHPTASVAKDTFKSAIPFDTFQKLDMRCGLIEKVDKVAKSEKLLKLEVNFGACKNTIVTGLALFYTPEALLNKKAIFVVNLPPAKIMGIESEGMLLTVEKEDRPEVLFVPDAVPVGASVS